jgi:hypothetical protein
MAKSHELLPDYSYLTDGELLEAYEQTDGAPHNAHVNALIAEIRRRVLQV